MKAKLLSAGYTEQGIIKFINTIETVLPHFAGNWEFMSIDAKLSFIQKHKQYISDLLYNAMPLYSKKEDEAIFLDRNFKKDQRYSELRSAIITLRINKTTIL